MRIFIALNIPKKERQRIHRAARALREEHLPVRWVDPDAYHITLKFLGDVRPERVPGIEEALGRVATSTSPFQMGLGGFGAFPTIRNPRVVWMGVHASPELRCLKQDLEWGLADCGFEAETRAFHPHLTLGRTRGQDGAGAFRGLDDLVATMSFEGKVQVRTVDLMRSRLSKEGARYSLVSSTRLGG
ncbi:MAG: RNA 2',3'-cyclic phosphodiesterase [Gemmatimonadota bacterium]|jgi:2'-5' RNA ligase